MVIAEALIGVWIVLILVVIALVWAVRVVDQIQTGGVRRDDRTGSAGSAKRSPAARP
jgi:hypothetical protein